MKTVNGLGRTIRFSARKTINDSAPDENHAIFGAFRPMKIVCLRSRRRVFRIIYITSNTRNDNGFYYLRLLSDELFVGNERFLDGGDRTVILGTDIFIALESEKRIKCIQYSCSYDNIVVFIETLFRSKMS